MNTSIRVSSVLFLAFMFGIYHVTGVPAKFKYTTTTAPETEYDDEEEEEESSDGDGESDDISKHITPECMKTLQKHKGDLEALQTDKRPETAEKLLQTLAKGGCKAMLDYMMKKHSQKQ
ncbi:unnamed protein product [Allacma fusca]|uniref:Uncharacterized protein n=1 Tax=Allacma fusca TaxID=39272 RepID=A0A8J2JKZ2_9HEXA|nr:unnamed protein product [Allacma fusca]